MIEYLLTLITIVSIGGLLYTIERNSSRSDKTIKLLTEAFKAKDLNDLVANQKLEKKDIEPVLPLEIPIEQMDDAQYVKAIKNQMNTPEGSEVEVI